LIAKLALKSIVAIAGGVPVNTLVTRTLTTIIRAGYRIFLKKKKKLIIIKDKKRK